MAKQLKQKSPAKRLLYSTGTLVRVVSLSRATIWRKVQDGKFPKPVRIGTRNIRWKKADIDNWIAELPVSNGDQDLATPRQKSRSRSRT